MFATKDERRYGLETHAEVDERGTGDGEVNESARTYPAPDVGRRSSMIPTRIEPAGLVETSRTGGLRTSRDGSIMGPGRRDGSDCQRFCLG